MMFLNSGGDAGPSADTVHRKPEKALSCLLASVCELLILRNQRLETCSRPLCHLPNSFPSSLNNTYWSSYLFLFSDLISLISMCLLVHHITSSRVRWRFLLCCCHHYNGYVLFYELYFHCLTSLFRVCMKESSLVQCLPLSLTLSASFKFNKSFE